MKSNLRLIIVSVICVLLIVIGCLTVPRFVFLAPQYYSDNASLNESENYFIKKQVLETVEDRLSVLGSSGKHLFVFINKDFMNSAEKNENGYIVCVNTYYMEEESDDCVYEIHFSRDLEITKILLDP